MTKLEKMMDESATFMGLCEDLMDFAGTADDLWGRIMSWSVNHNIPEAENPFFPEITDLLSELIDTINQLSK